MADWWETEELALLRPSYLFSEEEQRPRVLREFLVRNEREPFVVRDPTAMHDFIHIDDAVDGIILALLHRLTGVVNVGTGTRRSIAALLQAFDPRADIVPMMTRIAPTPSPLDDQPTLLLKLGWSPGRTDQLFRVQLGLPHG